MADFQRNITGGEAVTSVMETMGLTAPTSVYDSQDATAKQLWRLATDAGQEMLTEHQWQFLDKEFTITTVVGDPDYALPADWGRFITDSMWNRTTRLPAIGSLRQYEWQALKARNLAGTAFTMLFRIENNQVVFYDTPASVQSVVMAYSSRSWVRSAASVLRDNLQLNDDVVLYDSQLFKKKLKLMWLKEKNFDTTRAQTEYDDLLEKAKGADSPSRTISLVPRADYAYLGRLNIPDSGYGS